MSSGTNHLSSLQFLALNHPSARLLETKENSGSEDIDTSHPPGLAALYAESSPALGLVVPACNTSDPGETLRTMSIARRDCTISYFSRALVADFKNRLLSVKDIE
ncbi:hypothetical protein [Oligoflexus sp.]|uniref:hypothetical protein n=1 Tax=Oligoflexus sp. TaxID=1971216 RepID=UPI002D76AB2F|nr:hypothetical protein [Oligoflexus sp.]